MFKHSTLIVSTILLILLIKMLKLLIIHKLHSKKIILLSIFQMTRAFFLSICILILFLINLWKLANYLIIVTIIDWKKSHSLWIIITAIVIILVIMFLKNLLRLLKHISKLFRLRSIRFLKNFIILSFILSFWQKSLFSKRSWTRFWP